MLEEVQSWNENQHILLSSVLVAMITTSYLSWIFQEMSCQKLELCHLTIMTKESVDLAHIFFSVEIITRFKIFQIFS